MKNYLHTFTMSIVLLTIGLLAGGLIAQFLSAMVLN